MLRDMELTRHDLLSDKKLKPGTYVELSVSDTGCGIEDANLKRIFEPYFTTKGFGRSSGLGLSLVHGIIRDHGGIIKVETEVGKGSTFRIYFPAVREGTDHNRKNQVEQASPGTERILLIDDEASVVDVLREGLERLGYKVTASQDSGEAFQLFCANPNGFDLVITDQTMPNLTGTDLAQKIFKIRRDIPVILCTGFSSMVDEESALAMGIRHFVMKPVELAELARLVRTTLDRAAPRLKK